MTETPQKPINIEELIKVSPEEKIKKIFLFFIISTFIGGISLIMLGKTSSLLWFSNHLINWFSFILICLFFGVAYAYLKMKESMKGSNLPWKCFIPIFGKRFKKIAVATQDELAAKGEQYAPKEMPIEERRQKFMKFIMDLPTYSIDDSIFSRIVRNALEAGGARFQQVVLHDPSSIDDVSVFIRKVGNYYVYNGGIYLFPWDYQKSVQHWDINDCRPMEDKSPTAQWPSPKMNARYFWGIINSVAMNKEGEGIKSTLTWVMILLVIILAAVAISGYLNYQASQKQIEILMNISQSVKPT